MGYPDDLKLKSSMTLFSIVSDVSVFQQVLDKFYGGEKDAFTVNALREDDLTDRKVYQTRIGPVCMSKAEHEEYLQKLKEKE